MTDPVLIALVVLSSLVLPALGIAAAFFIVWARRQGMLTPPPGQRPVGPVRAPRYRRAESLLTPTEQHFYEALREAAGPGTVIQCKVRMADLLLSAPQDLASFRQVSQKHVDFVICTPHRLHPLVCVELDDASHGRAARQARDRFVDAAYQSAGLPLVHVSAAAHYSRADLLRCLEPHLRRPASPPF